MTSWLFHCYNLAYEFQWRKWGWFWDECLQILYVCVTIISSDPIVQLSSTGFTNKYINRDNIKELSIYLIFILDVFFMFSNNSGGYLLYGQKKAVCEHWAQIPLSCENLILFFFAEKYLFVRTYFRYGERWNAGGIYSMSPNCWWKCGTSWFKTLVWWVFYEEENIKEQENDVNGRYYLPI